MIKDYNRQAQMIHRQHSYIDAEDSGLIDIYRDQHGGFMSLTDAYALYKDLKGKFDAAKGIAEGAQKFGKSVYDLTTGESATSLKNMLPNADETGRPAFAGEMHVPLKLPNGKTGVANFAGPGTRVSERIARGDPPRTEVDKIAMKHDLDYTLAESVQDIKNADKKC